MSYELTTVTTMLKQREERGHFLPILLEGNKLCSGGNQLWFKGGEDKRGKKRSDFGSCGVVAAANIILYLNNAHIISKEDYMSLATLIYDNYITPFDTNKMPLTGFLGNRLSFGVWPISRFERGLLEYGREHGVSLKSKSISNNDLNNEKSFFRACGFIKKALKKNLPVVILLSHNPSAKHKGKSADRHYMVITQIDEIYEITETKGKNERIIKEKKLTDAEIVVASWGGENKINFKSIWYDSIFADIGRLLNKCFLTKWLGERIYKNINSVYIIYFY